MSGCDMCGEGVVVVAIPDGDNLCEFCMEQSFWDYQERMVF